MNRVCAQLWLAACLVLCARASAAPPHWWDADWPYRVRVECAAGEGDVAAVRVMLAGHTTKDGRDLRLVDADGRLRSFEILHHDPLLSTLIQFRVPPGEPLKTWLYYGNEQAAPTDTLNPGFDTWQDTWNAWKENQAEHQKSAAKRRTLNDELTRLKRRLERVRGAAGDSAELRRRIASIEQELEALKAARPEPAPVRPRAWYPQRGIVLRVYRKAREQHPDSLSGLRKLIRAGTLEGAGFRDAISDGFNRFGPSENYISVYEGYLRIDTPGQYAFCTVSDDGSWLLIDDKPLVAWPGEHPWHGAEHGEKSGVVKLKPGVVRVQYSQEEGTGDQMAFLGWKPPGAESFWGIPDEQWLSVRTAQAAAYEARDKPIIAVPIARVVNTYWIRDSDDRQATLVEFRDRSRSRAGKIIRSRWSFGNQLESNGQRVRHVYFRIGRPTVTLTVTDDRGNTDSVSCSPDIFRVDVRARAFRYGNAEQYARAAAGYDVQRMAGEDLQLYAEFWEYLEEWSEHVRAVDALIRRFPDSPEVPRLAASAARGCMQASAYDPRHAEELCGIALRGATTAEQRIGLDLELAETLSWGLDEHQRARTLLDAALTAAEAKADPACARLRRRALIDLGDVALLSGDAAQAAHFYEQAQKLGDKRPEPTEVLARIGSFGYIVLDLLARGEFDWALEALDRWEDELPTQKLEGYTFFLRGKVLFVQHPGPLALRYLELAERVAPRAVHVPEAVWLRANCLLAMERYGEALLQFQRIRSELTDSQYFDAAAAKIELCRSPLTPPDRPKDGG